MTFTLANLTDQIIAPATCGFSPEHARFVPALGFSDEVHARYADLSDRVQDGTLSRGELEELDAIVLANSMLGMMQARARASLRQHQPAA